VATRQRAYYRIVCFLTLKRNLVLAHRTHSLQLRRCMRTKSKILEALAQHSFDEARIRRFHDLRDLRLLQKYFVTFELIRNAKIQERQQSILANDFRRFKLKQLVLKSLK
jgi:hypothetical protein